jgi:hypothetical protein
MPAKPTSCPSFVQSKVQTLTQPKISKQMITAQILFNVGIEHYLAATK